MTIVAWDGRTLASDGQAKTGQMIVADDQVKVRHVDSMLFGMRIRHDQMKKAATPTFEDVGKEGVHHV